MDVERLPERASFLGQILHGRLGSLGSVLLGRKSLLLQTGLLERAGFCFDKHYLGEQVT